MSRKLDDLHPDFKQKVFVLLARTIEMNLPVVIVDTLRTQAEHEENLRKGVSWTKHSKHLDGKAIDLCPVKSYMGPGTTKANWDEVNPDWWVIGKLGERLGLKWGVWKESSAKVEAWRRREKYINIDLGHFEMP